MVRETKTLDELIDSARGIAVPLEGLRALQRAFVFGNTVIANPKVTREIIVRVDADFERIFGSCRLALPKHKSASRPVGPTNGSGFGEKNREGWHSSVDRAPLS